MELLKKQKLHGLSTGAGAVTQPRLDPLHALARVLHE